MPPRSPATSPAPHSTSSLRTCWIPQSLAEYRRLVPRLLVVRLAVSLEEARRRARTRTVYLTDEEFMTLHANQSAPLDVDYEIEVTNLDQAQQSERVRDLWTAN